jgi:hypothetical protein
MAILKYNASPRPAASLGNVNYILRDDACIQFEMINLPNIESKIDARSYAATRMIEEELMPKRGTGIPRNHHRMMLTMPDESNPDAAILLAKNFVEKEFPNTRSIIAIHQSENGIGLHAHAWVDARKIDGKKLDLGTKYTQLDKLYSQKYDETYGTNYTAEFAAARKFNAENEIPTYAKQLEKLIEAQEKNEQRRIISGKHLIEAAAVRINELATQQRTRLEIASGNIQPRRAEDVGISRNAQPDQRTPAATRQPESTKMDESRREDSPGQRTFNRA